MGKKRRMKKFGVGIIGAGNWAKWYVPALRNSEFLDLKGVSVGFEEEIHHIFKD